MNISTIQKYELFYLFPNNSRIKSNSQYLLEVIISFACNFTVS